MILPGIWYVFYSSAGSYYTVGCDDYLCLLTIIFLCLLTSTFISWGCTSVHKSIDPSRDEVRLPGEMPRKQDKAVPEGNGPVPHHDKFGSDEPPMMLELYRMIKERFGRSKKQFDDLTEKMIDTNHRLAGLQYGAGEPHLATEADDVEPDTKTRKRTESFAIAESSGFRSCCVGYFFSCCWYQV